MTWFRTPMDYSAEEPIERHKADSITIHDAYGAPAEKTSTQPGRIQPGQDSANKTKTAADSSYNLPSDKPVLPPKTETATRLSVTCLGISDKGLNVIQFYEGLRLKPYADMKGQQAIGYGHHIKGSEDFSNGITKAQADALLRKDLRWACYLVADKVKVPVSQGQYDALVSFVFNVGSRNFERSTLLKKLNSGDYEGATSEFQRWTKAGKPAKTLKGLVARRDAEKTLFATR